jgi:hypothetical protein
MSDLKWTKEKPTVVGAFWTKLQAGSKGEIFHTYRAGGVLKVEIYDTPVEKLDWWWHGPLKCPPFDGNRALEVVLPLGRKAKRDITPVSAKVRAGMLMEFCSRQDNAAFWILAEEAVGKENASVLLRDNRRFLPDALRSNPHFHYMTSERRRLHGWCVVFEGQRYWVLSGKVMGTTYETGQEGKDNKDRNIRFLREIFNLLKTA